MTLGLFSLFLTVENNSLAQGMLEFWKLARLPAQGWSLSLSPGTQQLTPVSSSSSARVF